MSVNLNNLNQAYSSPGQTHQEFDETSRAILDIENKKRAITQASNNEQNAIKSKINDEFYKIGEMAYSLYDEGNFEVEKIVGMFQIVKGFYQTMEEKQTKLNGILARYDEELAILRPAPPAGQEVCQSCGAGYIAGEMLFCNTCGNKLPAKGSDLSGSEAVASVTPTCKNCNAALIPNAVFCSSCGASVDNNKI